MLLSQCSRIQAGMFKFSCRLQLWNAVGWSPSTQTAEGGGGAPIICACANHPTATRMPAESRDTPPETPPIGCPTLL